VETYIYFAVSGTVSRLLPLAMGLLRWRELGRAGILLVSFVLLSFVGDVAMLLVWKVFRRSNLWISHVLIALQTPVLLLAFTEWARGSWLHRVLRVSAVLAVVAWLLLTLLLESPSRFARFTGPLQAALFCFAAIGVLVQRGLGSEGRLSSTDWFWAAAAVLLVYGLTAVYRPLLDLFTTRGITTIPAWTVLKSLMVLQVIANLMFTRSLFCSREPAVAPIPVPA
jgi:hypothetical protein